MPRSTPRMRCTRSIGFSALAAGSTVKTSSYLFVMQRASFARRPANASTTGDDSRSVVETLTTSTMQLDARDLARQPVPAGGPSAGRTGDSPVGRMLGPTGR